MTYYTGESESETILGTMLLVDEKTLRIKLDQDHGGCWNVSTFSNEPQQFELEVPVSRKCQVCGFGPSWFYADKSDSTRLKALVMKDDFVCVEKIADRWANCTFYGDVITRGWLREEELNGES